MRRSFVGAHISVSASITDAGRVVRKFTVFTGQTSAARFHVATVRVTPACPKLRAMHIAKAIRDDPARAGEFREADETPDPDEPYLELYAGQPCRWMNPDGTPTGEEACGHAI